MLLTDKDIRANINALDNHGSTPLDLVREGNDALKQTLRGEGAEYFLRDGGNRFKEKLKREEELLSGAKAS